MAFTSSGLTLIVSGSLSGGAGAIWRYVSDDISSAVGTLGYFAGMGAGSPGGSPKGIKIGDIILSQQTTAGATPGQVGFHSAYKSSANGSTLGSTYGLDVTVSTFPISTL